jgi:hypothetical protein
MGKPSKSRSTASKKLLILMLFFEWAAFYASRECLMILGGRNIEAVLGIQIRAVTQNSRA